MKKRVTITILLIFTLKLAFSQSIVDWSPEYTLALSDFQSPQTETRSTSTTYSIYSGAQIDFSFKMSFSTFMFTKNFNSKVKAIFNKRAAIIVAPDTTTAQQLVKVGQYSFDLTELYTRKFRKEIYENKGTFSGVDFFKPIFNDLKSKMNAENARVLKITDLGKNEKLLQQEHDKIHAEIEKLAHFCFDCKPPKRKKKEEIILRNK